MARIFFLMLLLISAGGCRNNSKDMIPPNKPKDFDPGTLRTDMSPRKQLSGQLLYLPIYSNMPYQVDTIMFDMSAFLAIHNTDLYSDIRLTKVLYFNQDGKVVDDFLKTGNYSIKPLATKDFYIPYEDQSGTGANFLVEWVADTVVNEPLIEAVTLCLKPNNTIAVLSQGKILSEKQ